MPVAQHQLTILLQLAQGVGLALVAAFTVGNRKLHTLLVPIALQEMAGAGAHDQLTGLTDEMEVLVACEGARQQAHLREHLKPIANAQHRAAIGGKSVDGM